MNENLARWRTRIPPAPLERQALERVELVDGPRIGGKPIPNGEQRYISLRIFEEEQLIGGGQWMLEIGRHFILQFVPAWPMRPQRHLFVESNEAVTMSRTIVDEMTGQKHEKIFDIAPIDPLVRSVIDARGKLNETR